MKCNYTLADVEKKASTPEEYSEGKEYYLNERVSLLNTKQVLSGTYISASVSDETSSISKVHAVLDNTGQLNSYSCTCRFYKNNPGICRHIVSTLFSFYYKNLEPVINKKKSVKIDKYKFFANKLVSVFEKEALSELQSVDSKSTLNGALFLCPNLIIDYNRVYMLSFSILHNRVYKIRNLDTFVEKFSNNSYDEYGKNFGFVHDVSAFQKSDVALLKFLISEMSELKSRIKNIDPYGYYKTKLTDQKFLMLTPKTLDYFLNLMLNRAIDLEILGDKYSSVYIREKEKLPITFGLERQDDIIKLKYASNNQVITFNGMDALYIFNNSTILKCDERVKKTLVPILNIFSDSGEETLYLSGETLNKFLMFVFPKLEELSIIESDEALLNEVGLFPLVSKIYLDKNGNWVSATVYFCYGDTEINPLSHSHKGNAVRDKLAESKVLMKLVYLGFIESKPKKQFIMYDDDKIFNLVQSGIDELRDVGEVFISDSFKNITVRYPQPLKLGVRLKGELLELTFDTSEFQSSDLLKLLDSHKLKKKYHRLTNGSFISTESEEIQAVKELVEGLNITENDMKSGTLMLPRFRALYLDNLIKRSESIVVEKDATFKRMTSEIRDFSDSDFQVPQKLSKILRGYQKIGFKWLKILAAYGLGGILADDMGLGKTLQVITVLLEEKPTESKPSIVIAPTSLVYNWENEINKFAPELKSLPVVGTALRREELIQTVNDYDVVITSFDTLKRDIDQYDKFEFKYAIVDEAQNIKNANTQNAKAVKLLNSQVRFALTGTPIENSLSELWSIFDFLMPGYLYNNTKFQKTFETPIVKNNDEEKIQELRKHIAPFILRRLKKDVLRELPDKIETTLLAEMSDEQKKMYAAYLLKARGEIELEIAFNGFQKSQIKILALLTRLRQICCHPSLFAEDYTGGCGKFDLLMEVIQDCFESGHRILLFSQFTSMLHIIMDELDKNQMNYYYLDGSTPAKTRIEMVDKFNNGTNDLFLISLKAGGTGLNLTGADVVIHYDPWWNPAVQNQATDRAYRIGQKNKVQVFNLVTKDSIEEKIINLQNKKRDLTDSVIKEGTSFLTKMTQEEIRALFEEK